MFINKLNLSITDMIESGTLSSNDLSIIKDYILKNKNILILGGTGSGRTSLLNNLCEMVPIDNNLYIFQTDNDMKVNRDNKMIIKVVNGINDTIPEIQRFYQEMDENSYLILSNIISPEKLFELNENNKGYICENYSSFPSSLIALTDTEIENKLTDTDVVRMFEKIDLSGNETINKIFEKVDLIIFTYRLPSGSRKLKLITKL